MTTMYAVIIADRHTSVDVEIHTDRDAAIAAARTAVDENARHPQDIEVLDIDGYEAYISYSPESDYVAVLAREVQS